MPLRHTLTFLAAVALLTGCEREEREIRFEALREAEVMVVGIRDGDGVLVRQLAPGDEAVRMATSLDWDGFDDAGRSVKPGTYTWTAVAHRGFGWRPSGGACLDQSPDRLPIPSQRNRWGGEGGMPTAVAADDSRVYLGWSGGQVVACDLDGQIIWSVALPDGAACEALAVDGASLVALARSRPPYAAVDHLVKLDGKSGDVQGWPTDKRLPLTALWPKDAEAHPAHATAMAARSGRIYLTFSELQFLAVLRTDTGEYLQTVVGPPPGCIDVTPTKSEAPDEPGKLIAADFAVVALQGGTLGKVLFAHDPLWVMMSDFQPLDREERITALALLGDGAKHHAHSVFVGLGAPFHQVQRRSVLASEGFLWIAGSAGGRPSRGAWNPDALGPVKAVALDARGRLWIAEGDAVPPRFSVWNTEGNQGRLEREFFGPVGGQDTGAAVLPNDPEIIVGGGCEWRIDPAGGPAACLGLITRDGMAAARFRTAASGALHLLVRHPDRTFSVFERRGEGDYVPHEQHSTGAESEFESGSRVTLSRTGITLDLGQITPGVWQVSMSDGLRLGIAKEGLGVVAELSAPNANGVSSIAQTADGKIYAATVAGGLVRGEITGLEGIRRLPGGKLIVPPKK